MRKLSLLLFIFTVSSANASVVEKACRPGQDREVQLTKYRAAVRVDALLVKIRQNLNRSDISFNLRRKLHVAGNILHCARRTLGTLKYVCADSNLNFSARTYPVISNKVYLADNYFQDTNIRQRATLIHEATHHCGTNDALYFEEGRPPSDAYLIGWQIIADTYSYWAENGFCIPGYCR